MTTDTVDRYHKVCLTGVPGVGKTSLFTRIRTGCFQESLSRTTLTKDTHQMIRNIDGKEIRIAIYDTAGLEYYGTLCHSYYRNASVVLYVFANDDILSLEGLVTHVEEATRYVNENCFFGLVCNKIDLQSDDGIPQSIIESKCTIFACDKVYYVSAKTGNGVREMVDNVFAVIKKYGDFNELPANSLTLRAETYQNDACDNSAIKTKCCN